MAEIVLGIGSSHTPMLTLSSDEWAHRAGSDVDNPRLNLSDGRWVTYQELEAEFGCRYTDNAAPEELERQSVASEDALDRLGKALEETEPDVVLIIGDDQGELYKPGTQPAVAIYYGEELVMHKDWTGEKFPEWMNKMAKGYAMDSQHRFPGHPELARELIEGLIDHHVDISVMESVDESGKMGFGHAFGFIIKRLFGGATIPVVPILLNTYYPPNVVTSERAYNIGQIIQGLIDNSSLDLKVAVIASGGLSHFVTDAELDQRVLDGFAPGNSDLLKSIPCEALNSGSSEILNWVMLAGSIEHLKEDWIEYYPVYRTPAGTGCGVGFGVWSKFPQENNT